VKHYQFKHTADPSIVYDYRKPTTAEFAAYWNATVGHTSNITAESNLAIAVRESPDEETFKELLDAEWSSLPSNVNGLILRKAGLCPIGAKANEDHCELVSLAKLAAECAKNPIEKPDDGICYHIERIKRLLPAEQSISQWLGKRNPDMTRIVVALPTSIGGYYVGRVPGLNDRILAQRVQNAPASDEESGAFDALCRLFLDCCLWCAPLTPAQMIEQWPGAVAVIAIAVRDLGSDSFAIEQKKSNP
jgi:hypothetical protein